MRTSRNWFALLMLAAAPLTAQTVGGRAGGGGGVACVNGVCALPPGSKLAIGTALLDPVAGVSTPKLTIRRAANGAIALHSLVKGVAGGQVGPVASDAEGILGVAEDAAANPGDVIRVTVQGPTTILCESSTDLNYLSAGADPTKVKDSGQSVMTGIPLSTRVVAKAMGACTAGVVMANVIGPYRFGAQPPPLIATATGFRLPAANFPTLIDVSGTNTIYSVLGYPDTDGDFSGQFSFPLPSFASISLTLRWQPAVAATGSVVWQVATACAAGGASADPAFNAVQTITSAAPAATELTDATISAVTTTGCAAGSQMWVKVLRNRTHASDTLNQIPYLHNVRVQFN